MYVCMYVHNIIMITCIASNILDPTLSKLQGKNVGGKRLILLPPPPTPTPSSTPITTTIRPYPIPKAMALMQRNPHLRVGVIPHTRTHQRAVVER